MKIQIISLSLATMLLTACGGGDKPSTTGNSSEKTASSQSYEFTINATGNTMMDMTYDTREMKVKAGSKVKVNLLNKGTDGAMMHNIVFVKPGTEKEVAMEGISLKDQNYFNSGNPNVIAGSAIAQPGGSVTLEFKAPEPGTYTYICTYPGHWQKMQGTLIVE